MVWRVSTEEEGSMIQNEQNSSAIYNFQPIGHVKFITPGKHFIAVSFVDGAIKTASLKAIRLTSVNSMD